MCFYHGKKLITAGGVILDLPADFIKQFPEGWVFDGILLSQVNKEDLDEDLEGRILLFPVFSENQFISNKNPNKWKKTIFVFLDCLKENGPRKTFAARHKELGLLRLKFPTMYYIVEQKVCNNWPDLRGLTAEAMVNRDVPGVILRSGDDFFGNLDQSIFKHSLVWQEYEAPVCKVSWEPGGSITVLTLQIGEFPLDVTHGLDRASYYPELYSFALAKPGSKLFFVKFKFSGYSNGQPAYVTFQDLEVRNLPDPFFEPPLEH